MKEKFPNPYNFPVICFFAIIVTHIAIYVTNTSIEDAQKQIWLFEPLYLFLVLLILLFLIYLLIIHLFMKCML